MKQPKVSVIITTRNRSKLAERAIQSVLKQDYNNFDLHIVDDASEDDTQEVLDWIIKANDKVFYWRHDTRRGLSAARNTGLLHSEGKYVTFLDDDDVYKPNFSYNIRYLVRLYIPKRLINKLPDEQQFEYNKIVNAIILV